MIVYWFRYDFNYSISVYPLIDFSSVHTKKHFSPPPTPNFVTTLRKFGLFWVKRRNRNNKKIHITYHNNKTVQYLNAFVLFCSVFFLEILNLILIFWLTIDFNLFSQCTYLCVSFLFIYIFYLSYAYCESLCVLYYEQKQFVLLFFFF